MKFSYLIKLNNVYQFKFETKRFLIIQSAGIKTLSIVNFLVFWNNFFSNPSNSECKSVRLFFHLFVRPAKKKYETLFCRRFFPTLSNFLKGLFLFTWHENLKDSFNIIPLYFSEKITIYFFLKKSISGWEIWRMSSSWPVLRYVVIIRAYFHSLLVTIYIVQYKACLTTTLQQLLPVIKRLRYLARWYGGAFHGTPITFPVTFVWGFNLKKNPEEKIRHSQEIIIAGRPLIDWIFYYPTGWNFESRRLPCEINKCIVQL